MLNVEIKQNQIMSSGIFGYEIVIIVTNNEKIKRQEFRVLGSDKGRDVHYKGDGAYLMAYAFHLQELGRMIQRTIENDALFEDKDK